MTMCDTHRSIYGMWAVLIGMLAVNVSHAAPYTFEGLSNGNIIGQDNWEGYAPLANNEFIVGDATDTGVNTSKIAQAGNDYPAFAVRPNDTQYSFTAHSNTATNAILQFDIRANITNPKSSGGATYFGLAYDADNDGSIDTARERSPAFGIIDGEFAIQHLGDNIATEKFGNINIAFDGDWLRLRMEVDFTANAGNGAAHLYYMNLTDGETSFTQITTTAVDLQLITNYDAIATYVPTGVPSNWDTMIVVQAGNASATPMQVDNLNANLIPEPATLGILATMGVAGMLRRKRTSAR